jgi:hypothetical protein
MVLTRLRTLIASVTLTTVTLAAVPVICQTQSEFFPYIGLRADSNLAVTETLIGSPARQAGLMPGDRIISINGISISTLDHETAVRKMRGGLGTKLDLKVSRDSKQYSVSIIRTASRPVGTSPQVVPVIDDLDKGMIQIVERTALTDSAYRSVVQGLDFLPSDVKRSFLDAGVSVVITPALEKIGSKGLRSEYSPDTHRVIICEHNSDGTTADLQRLHITTLHELGHAFDQLRGYPSRGAEFQAIYDKEALRVPSEYQQVLSYFLQSGKAGARECFATLFACKYYRGNDRRLTALKASFPQAFEFVQRLHF